MKKQALIEPDKGCICHGNWRKIIAESQFLLGKRFQDEDGVEYTFYGVVYGDDDYYYGMCDDKGRAHLLSCVGSLEMHGYQLVQFKGN